MPAQPDVIAMLALVPMYARVSALGNNDANIASVRAQNAAPCDGCVK
jgi:hypothetical protein